MEINGDPSTDRFNFLLEGDNLHSLHETQFLTFLLAPTRLLKQSWNGNDCYGYEDISSHDNSFDYSIEDIYVGDYVYYSDDNSGYTRYVRNEPKGHEAKYNLPEAFRNAKNLSFSRGYIGTVNGEEYEIEEWDLVNDTAVFFCQNGEVKAFKYEVNDSERCFYITRYEKTADEQYIAAPRSSREIID